MARQVIIMDVGTPEGGELSVRAAMWFPVTAGQEVPRPGMTSAVPSGKTYSPTTQEATDLQDGKVVEEVKTFPFPSAKTETAIKADLVSFYQQRAAYLATLPFQGAHFGKSYNGTVWSA